MSRLNSSRQIQIDTSEPRYDDGDDETLDESNDGLKFQPSNSNLTEDLEPFMGVKVRRKASRLRDYQGDYIDVQSRPHLMKILEKQGDRKVLFADKVIKFTGSGKMKRRILLITDFAIYIADPDTDALKRRIALAAVEKLCLSELSDNFFAIIIPTEYDLLMASTRKIMASLQSSFSKVLGTNPNPNPRNTPFSKPSQLASSNARRSHRFQVSCSSGGGGIDRRNMLLGLGGLYGASSLVSDRKANADPIAPPDLSSCDAQGATTTKDGQVVSLDVNCCPPFTDVQNDYKLPKFSKPRVRQSAHRLSPANIDKYNRAMAKMRELDVTDPDDPRGFTQQANVHCAYCNGPYDQVGFPGVDLQVHNSWIFFPFHRWYLYFYERILGELIGDPTFALPYWNWDNPRGMSMPPAFDNTASALYDQNRNQLHRRPAVVDLALNSGITDPVQMISNNLTLMYKEMIGDVESAIDFMGTEYRAGDAPHAFPLGGTSERGSHTGIHVWVGDPDNEFNEDMGNFYSAGRDPMFYCHHANVDRMWTIWDGIPADYSKKIDDADLKNAAFMFYDEKKNLVRVRAGDCFDHKKMGYVYQHSDTPWMNYRAPQKTVPVNLKDISKGVKTVDKVFPLKPTKTAKVLVSKPTKGKADEVLVLENIVTDNTKLVKFDVFINDEDDKPEELDRAEYVGAFTQLPHRVKAKESVANLRLNLKEVYENINIADDDAVVVTIVPQINGNAVTIGGIKIIPRAK